MSSFMWLTDDEVKDLTRREQAAAQERVLREAGIKFKEVDGRPVVLRSELEQNYQPPEPALRLRHQ